MSWNATASLAPGAFEFYTPAKSGDESDDSYQTVDEDDDEYEPLSISGWGENAAKEEEPATWNNLIDTSIKVKAGGVGSGDLHRRGGNFKPLSEASILAQRLNKPIPGKKLGGGGVKPCGGKKKKSAAPGGGVGRPSFRPPIRPTRRPAPVAYVPPARERPANAPPSSWGQALVETPFWESKKPDTPTPRPASRASAISVLCETPFWETKKTTTTTTASAAITTNNNNIATNTATSTIITTGGVVVEKKPEVPQASFQCNVNVSGFEPVKKRFDPSLPAFNPSAAAHNVNAPAFNFGVASFDPIPTTTSRSSSTLSSTSSSTIFNTNVPEFLPFVQLATPKPVKITPAEEPQSDAPKRTRISRGAANPLLLKQLQNINSGINQKPKTSSIMEDLKTLSMDSQTGPESTRGLEEPVPLIQIDLELAPGISTEILVYEDSSPEQLVEEFAQKHKLKITNTAKAQLVITFQSLLKAKKKAIEL
ncbi:hypothetical protein HPULCUR_010414 [Helicostylum pulchrum]|uniref:Uncharacterized protein n=1 Tax=Helicostylum pulchrum TaxID=562976 RepID=A0ABP9YE46_9FUNG